MCSRIPHPPSTNYDEASYSPPAKRLKRFESRDDNDDDDLDNVSLPSTTASPRRVQSEIADSEEELDSDEDAPMSHGLTNLENALPPVKTDKEAIAEYEAMMKTEDASGQLASRMAERKWTRGKTSIYVDAFNLALDTVLEDERHLFDEKEIEVFDQWRLLEYEEQYL